jgi:peptidoglycan/LPS O-acetylase OafA/YrhL
MKNYIPSLNGLRALSILMVISAHVNGWSLQQRIDPKFPFFFFNGTLGVNIFFVISGFLITTLLVEEEKLTGNISMKKFYARRMLRIFPAFYFLLFVYFILECTGLIYIHPNSWATSFTYTKYFPIPNGSERFTGHFWSLSVEEHFYLFWPFVFKYLKKIRNKIALAIIIIAPFLRLLGDKTGIPILKVDTFFYSMDALMIGCLFAIYKNKILAFLNRLASINKALIYLPLFLLVLLHYTDDITLRYIYSLKIITVPFGTLGTLGSVSIGLMILMSSNFSNNAWYSFLNNPVMNYIGKLSYSLYLWQQIFFSKALTPLNQFPLNLLFIFIAGSLSYYLIERPFLTLKSKFETV